MKLATINRTIPIRAIPDEELNRTLLMDFLPWVASLLSLTDETSAERLEIALPAIKEQCIGMGFVEIKKMFEMYVDGRMSIKPIPNYFDRILLGKIVSEYKSRNKTPKKMEEKQLSKEDQENIMLEAVDRIKREYKHNKEITGTFVHVYEYLYKKGVLPKHTKEFKSRILENAKRIAKSDAMTKAGGDYNFHRQLKDVLEKIENNEYDSVKSISKRLVLEEYFKNNQ